MSLRYLINFDSGAIQYEKFDVIIIGSGIAGLYSAIHLHDDLSVCIISKESIGENNSYLAQGGIAAAVTEEDQPEYHFDDTIKAGAGHCDEAAVKVLVNEAPVDIQTLCNIGTRFDRNPDGTLTTTREGGHGRFRVIHALGDATGKEVIDSLISECKKRTNIKIIENCFAVDILTINNKCTGILVKNNTNIPEESQLKIYHSRKIICASGGIGQVYKNTTNTEVITGDGIAMAFRAGAQLTDMEFVQFHPTAFYKKADNENSFLISEALRGEGGILRNINGEPFMSRYHEMGEIAPRDIVSRAIFSEIKKTNSEFVYLDITHKDSEHLRNRFPTIYNRCLKADIDISKDYIPVVPVQHYFMGGIKTDLWGRTSIEGLYACGEAACTGVHGANRLASNSLLEGLIFGRRCAEDINSSISESSFDENIIINTAAQISQAADIDIVSIRNEIKQIMNDYAGIERNEADMKNAAQRLESIIRLLESIELGTVYVMETINIAYIAALILKSAINRKQSIGSHYRTD